MLNTVGMGPFSSDRSVREYAQRIWNIRSVILLWPFFFFFFFFFFCTSQREKSSHQVFGNREFFLRWSAQLITSRAPLLGYQAFPRAEGAPLCVVRVLEPGAESVDVYWEDPP